MSYPISAHKPRPRIAATLALLLGLALAFGLLAVPGTAAADDGFETTAKPNFQAPFPCGQVWSGQTRTNHRPRPSIDFNRANDFGDPVAASAGGTVTTVANTGGTSYGRYVIVSHGGGWQSLYAHLSAFNVSKGQKIGMGKIIGRVGSSGGSTGPHLHFEQRYNGSAVRVVFNGQRALYYGTKNYKSYNRCGGNPYTAKQVCGSNFNRIDSKGLFNNGKRVGLIVLMYNSGTKKNCVVTLKTTALNRKTKVVAFLRVQDGPRGNDSGQFRYYAGPVKFKAGGTCVKWGGSTGGASFTSGWGHCG